MAVTGRPNSPGLLRRSSLPPVCSPGSGGKNVGNMGISLGTMWKMVILLGESGKMVILLREMVIKMWNMWVQPEKRRISWGGNQAAYGGFTIHKM